MSLRGGLWGLTMMVPQAWVRGGGDAEPRQPPSRAGVLCRPCLAGALQTQGPSPDSTVNLRVAQSLKQPSLVVLSRQALMDFRSRPMVERAEVLRQARPGGSITPSVMEALRRVEAESQRVRVIKGAHVVEAQWGGPRMAGGRGWRVTDSQGLITEAFDLVILATGE
jgi:hypothetical protein